MRKLWETTIPVDLANTLVSIWLQKKLECTGTVYVPFKWFFSSLLQGREGEWVRTKKKRNKIVLADFNDFWLPIRRHNSGSTVARTDSFYDSQNWSIPRKMMIHSPFQKNSRFPEECQQFAAPVHFLASCDTLGIEMTKACDHREKQLEIQKTLKTLLTSRVKIWKIPKILLLTFCL